VTQTDGLRPDPWAVVEHHAGAAPRGGDADLTTGQRLAMYVSVAPQVVGARQMSRAEQGLRGAGKARWVVHAPDGGAPIAFDESGNISVAVSSSAQRVVAAAAGFVVATALFARIAGPRAIIAGLIVAVGAYAVSAAILPRWRPIGVRAGDERYELMLADLVARYERAVPPPP
jgi:hypothetical protein